MKRKKQEEKILEKIDKRQMKKELVQALISWFDFVPTRCPECGEPTKDKLRTTFIRRDYPEPEGFDAIFACETCGMAFSPEPEDMEV